MGRPQVVPRSVDCRVLGAIELRTDSSVIDVGGYRQRRLLAVLLSRAGEAVDTDSLVEFVWDDEDRPENADRAIRTYISRLRGSLTAWGLDAGALLVTVAPGYRFAVGEVDGVDVVVDADRFALLVAGARSHVDSGDPAGALRDLDAALRLWHGAPYQEFADRAWIEGEVARLVELWRVAREERQAIRLRLGGHAEAVAELELLVAEDRLRSRPVELLMLALHRSNRQADAMRVAGRYRRDLGEIGLDPSESVVELESRIATSDDVLRPSRPHNGNLPHPASSFIGRQEEVDALASQLRHTRLLTLAGPGGVGKTRLALEAAAAVVDSFGDGIWFAALADVDGDDQVAPRLAAALEVNDWSDEAIAVITRRLVGERSLLVIDNCEHVLDGVCSLVETLLERTEVTLLCTSREGLGVDGETLRPVGPLDADAARRLLLDRAQAAGASIEPADSAVDVVCARLDGLPLAIELAAARVRGIGVAELGRALDDHPLLLAGRRGRIERHRTMRATIDWSHDLLEPAEQVVFRRLAPFVNGFTLAAAESVVGLGELHGPEVFDAVIGLVDKSMLVTFDGRTGLRYRLLEPIRQAARERVVAAGEADAVECAFVDWAVRSWTDLADRLESVDEPQAVPEAIDEWDNLVAAADQAARRDDLDSAFELIWSTRRFAIYRGGFDVVSWASPLLERPEAKTAPAFAEAAVLVAIGETRRGNYEAAAALLDRVVIARSARPEEVGWRASMVRGFVESGGRHDLLASLPHYRNILSYSLSPADEAIQRANLGALLSTREPAESQEHAKRARELLGRHQLPPSQRALVLALLALAEDDPVQVRRLAEESLELADRVGATWPAGLARGELFRVAVLHDDPLDAFALLEEMVPDLIRTGQLYAQQKASTASTHSTMDASTVLWTSARLLTRLGMHREALILDQAISASGVRTLAVHDPALVALNPDPERFNEHERRQINTEAVELLDPEPGSLRSITRWLTSIEPPRRTGES